MNRNILVSIYSLAYNHEKYIRKALDGFVMQKTSFAFEVIIHDDASTDATAEIIKEYAEKYSFIKPIYEEENQYSKDRAFPRRIIFPKLIGKYIACCEGDDYWTDENKLQKMIDYMEAHPECSMSCHAYYEIEANSEKVIRSMETLPEEGDLSMQQVIMYNNPTQLATQVFRRDVFIERPDIFWSAKVGDYPILLYSAVCGTIHYFKDNMANHRMASDGSWTVRVYKNPEKRLEHWKLIRSFLLKYDEYYNYTYHELVLQKLDKIDYTCSLIVHDYKSAKKYKAFSTATGKNKAVISLGAVCPSAAQWIEKITGKSLA